MVKSIIKISQKSLFRRGRANGLFLLLFFFIKINTPKSITWDNVFTSLPYKRRKREIICQKKTDRSRQGRRRIWEKRSSGDTGGYTNGDASGDTGTKKTSKK